ncbi:GNAT family N-acetyltransferase [Arcticibacter eurypsychrophilus]|uniref:GNAT family N-acetyltransferase n=1 Tax=Arcticibacter eurypsychrophilus TaxID=1434752 RepID=UPI00084DA0A1|nr:GNAT family N-acetyltransferase [Arcticibacter eurypsychrophilus]
MISLITVFQKKDWTNYVQQSLQYDFYHTWYYHSLIKDDEPLLFVLHEGDDFVAFPLLKRTIPNSDLYDLTCVYGYTGPISNRRFDDLPTQMMDDFKSGFLNYLKEAKIVSVFSRLHPFFNQIPLMEKFEGVCDNGKVVILDLQMPLEEQRSKYQKRALEKIRQLRRNGFEVKEAHSQHDINAFVKIYTENMKRIGATDFYLFNEEYFEDLLSSKEFNSKLLMVYHNGEPVCGSVIICTQNIIQAHLLGTRTDHFRDSPAKLLTDEISIIGRQLGMHYFNLGGGVGFKEDSLFLWKSAFSSKSLDFKSWRYIADLENYNTLVNEAQLDPELNVDYFPLYRYHNPQVKLCS